MDFAEALKTAKVTVMKQSDIAKCPFVIMDPSHYNEDGSCKCHDPEYRENVMRKQWHYTQRDFQRAGLVPKPDRKKKP